MHKVNSGYSVIVMLLLLGMMCMFSLILIGTTIGMNQWKELICKCNIIVFAFIINYCIAKIFVAVSFHEKLQINISSYHNHDYIFMKDNFLAEFAKLNATKILYYNIMVISVYICVLGLSDSIDSVI